MKNNKLNVIIVVLFIIIGVVVTPFCAAIGTYTLMVSTADMQGGYFLGYKPIIVVTGSMEPTIKVNSVSIVKECSIDEVDVGDIVMYKSPNISVMVTHRVIAVTEVDGQRAVITKGDANEYQDTEPVTQDMLSGKIVHTANFMVPVISQILPEPGIVNTIAITKAIALFIVITVISALIISAITGAVIYTIRIYQGESKYEAIMQEYMDQIQENEKIHEKIVSDVHRGEYKFLFRDKIVIAICRAMLIKQFNDTADTTRKLRKQSDRYHRIYTSAFKRAVEKQERLLEKLKQQQEKLQEVMQTEEKLHEDMSKAIQIDVSNEVKQLPAGNTDSYNLSAE